MVFAQLTFRESLRDFEACLRVKPEKLYHMGLRSSVARNTLANANAVRDWRIYAEFAQRLIAIARKLYANESLGVELSNTVYALDSTTIDLCLSLFPWPPFCSTKAAVTLHTLLDLRGNIPTFLHISDSKLYDISILDRLIAEAGAFYAMDRGYLDFKRLSHFDQAGAFFVTRAKRGLRFKRLAWRTTRSQHRRDPRSRDHPHRVLFQAGLPEAAAAHSLQGPRDRQDPHLLDQPLRSASSTICAGRSSSSSNGSSSTCASRRSSVPRRTL